MYIVTKAFRDLNDDRRLYQVGDTYPAEGKPSKARVAELMNGTNKNGKVYLKEVAEPKTEAPAEDAEVAEPKTKAAKGKSRSKAAQTEAPAEDAPTEEAPAAEPKTED